MTQFVVSICKNPASKSYVENKKMRSRGASESGVEFTKKKVDAQQMRE